MTLIENFKVENDGIWISKDEIQSWKNHYERVADACELLSRKMYYSGMADVLIDLLDTIQRKANKI